MNKYIAIFFISLFGQNISFAQTNIEFDSTLFEEVVLYSAEEFDKWLIPKLQSRALGQKPLFEAALVLDRLRSDKFTTNKAILSMVNSFIENDKEILRKNIFVSKENLHIFSSVNYIDTLLAAIYERPFLETQLFKKRIETINNNLGIQLLKKTVNPDNHHVRKGYSFSIEQHEKAISLSDSLRVETIISKNFISYNLARYYLENNEFKLAEYYYGDILQCPFFREKDNKIKRLMYDQYIAAGKDLLWMRKDNLPYLERTFFTKAAEPVLKPIRDKMIADLKK